ncbi:MAG: hypothetical protein RLZZ32_330 [Cyanobacteriota bacterium]|jgi:hypothetical protein
MDYALPLLVGGIVIGLALYGVRELIRELAIAMHSTAE